MSLKVGVLICFYVFICRYCGYDVIKFIYVFVMSVCGYGMGINIYKVLNIS